MQAIVSGAWRRRFSASAPPRDLPTSQLQRSASKGARSKGCALLLNALQHTVANTWAMSTLNSGLKLEHIDLQAPRRPREVGSH